MKYLIVLVLIFAFNNLMAQEKIETENGELLIHLVAHCSLYLEYQDKIIHIDPWSRGGDYSTFPDADYILITHQHGDHLDASAIKEVCTNSTKMYGPRSCESVMSEIGNTTVVGNGEKFSTSIGTIEVVPAYNLVHRRSSGQAYHPRGEGNGYVISIDGVKIYVAGDTENVPEMANLKNIDIAFLPMNLPNTMTPEMVSKAVQMFQPKILYPYHYGNTDTSILVDLLSDSDTEVRIRSMK